jgi:hypothetical protein
VVEVAGARKPGCGQAEAPRETFLVDVSADRLETKGGAGLKKWPDGSDPGAPANAPVELDPMGPLRDALFAMDLTPVRFQGYGRGAYLVITLAGWRNPIAPGAPPEAMRDFAARTCAANTALPLGFLAGIDRATILRVRCGDPPSARWGTLK